MKSRCRRVFCIRFARINKKNTEPSSLKCNIVCLGFSSRVLWYWLPLLAMPRLKSSLNKGFKIFGQPWMIQTFFENSLFNSWFTKNLFAKMKNTLNLTLIPRSFETSSWECNVICNTDANNQFLYFSPFLFYVIAMASSFSYT